MPQRRRRDPARRRQATKRPRTPAVRTGQGSVALTKEEFRARFLRRFQDPAFEATSAELERIVAVAWEAYREDRGGARMRPAGPGFEDPAFELPIEWLETRARVLDA